MYVFQNENFNETMKGDSKNPPNTFDEKYKIQFSLAIYIIKKHDICENQK